jgi:hypothetical protein
MLSSDIRTIHVCAAANLLVTRALVHEEDHTRLFHG